MRESYDWIDSQKSRTINYSKGHAKSLLTLLVSNMTSELQVIEGLLQDIYALSHREHMNKVLYLESRRKKAQEVKRRLDELFDQQKIEESLYKTMKKQVNQILFENFSKQILPAQTWIITADNQKKEDYLNPWKLESLKVLEPRQYIGIDPNAETDLDAPSLVTAMTPPEYEQPWHDHGENRELTFYTWPSIGKYQTEGVEKEIKADFGDMIIFPPQTRHTIKNPTQQEVMNMSIKLPSALLDRGKEYKGAKWEWEKRSLIEVEKNHHVLDIADVGMPYTIEVYAFDQEKPTWEICNEHKSLIYPLLNSEYLVSSETIGKKVLRFKDALVLAAHEKLSLEYLWEGVAYIYVVSLIE